MSSTMLEIAAVLLTCISLVMGHGLMVDPPARNTIWRLGFPNPINYDDMALNCGGFSNQWDKNNGKCGVCGDPYQGPLKHQAGYPGGYANGIIGKHYKRGEVITIKTKITANHLGYMTFKVCPVNNPSAMVTQQCLDKNPLADVNGNKKVYIHDQIGNGPGFVTARLQLPKHLTCKQCVIQWYYTAGNNAGPEGTTPQESFVNCADVKISVAGGPQPVPPKITDDRKTINYKTDEFGVPIKDNAWDCDLVSPYNVGQNVKRNYKWCIDNCITAVPLQRSCPSNLCKCYTVDIDPKQTTTRQPRTTTIKSGKLNPSEWKCDVTPTYSGGSPDQLRARKAWCKEICILADPDNRKCPSNICNCYKITDVTTKRPQITTTEGGDIRIPSQWTCDLVSPYNVGRNTRRLHTWCINNCIMASPRDRNCPSTHCNCYKSSGGRPPSNSVDVVRRPPSNSPDVMRRPQSNSSNNGSSNSGSSSRKKLRTPEGYCSLVSMSDERASNSDSLRKWCASNCLSKSTRYSRQRCPTNKCHCVRR